MSCLKTQCSGLGNDWECCGSERMWRNTWSKRLTLWLSECIRSKWWERFTFYPRVFLPGQSFHPSLFMSNSSIINAQEMTFDPQALFWRPCHTGMQEPVEKRILHHSTLCVCVCESSGRCVLQSSSQSCYWNRSGDTLSSLDRRRENKLLSRKWTGRKHSSPQKLPFTRKHAEAVEINPEASWRTISRVDSIGLRWSV